MYDRAGKLRGFSKVLHDITDRKRAEDQLAAQGQKVAQQSEDLMHSQQALEMQSRMLQSVLDSMAEGLVAADEQGKFILGIRRPRRLWDWARQPGQPAVVRTLRAVSGDMVTPFPPEQNPLARAIRVRPAALRYLSAIPNWPRAPGSRPMRVP